MKQIKTGYRLTPEEEAIVRGELPADAREPKEESGEKMPEKKKNKKKTGNAMLALLAALLLMIGLAYLFFYLVSGKEIDPQPAEIRADSLYSTIRKEFAHLSFPALSPEERDLVLRKLSLTAAEEEIFWPVFYEFANRSVQASATHRAWLSALAQEKENTPLTRHFKNQYVSVYKEYINLSEHYTERFTEMLSADRAPWVFVLFEEIRQRRMK